jgi:hypothetical protein
VREVVEGSFLSFEEVETAKISGSWRCGARFFGKSLDFAAEKFFHESPDHISLVTGRVAPYTNQIRKGYLQHLKRDLAELSLEISRRPHSRL